MTHRSATLTGIIVLMMLAAGAATAATLVVCPDDSGDFPTIAKAVDAAVDGDVVELCNGTFTGPGNRDITIAKQITVRSQSGSPGQCVIDCEDSSGTPHRAFYFDAGAGSQARLEGITITKGFTVDVGGGAVFIQGSSPTIANCHFRDNEVTGTDAYGGAILGQSSSVEIVDCVVEYNQANSGGGIFLAACPNSSITGTDISHNIANNTGGGLFLSSQNGGTAMTECLVTFNTAPQRGGGVYCLNDDPSVIANCTFAENSGGVATFYFYDGAVPVITNSIIFCSSGERAIYCDQSDDPVNPSFGCSDIYDLVGSEFCGTDLGNNFSADPLFCHPEAGDFSLQDNSPCTQLPECGLIGAGDVGCSTAVEPTTWGAIKAQYR